MCKPELLPLQAMPCRSSRPRSFELVINLKIAKALGLEVPLPAAARVAVLVNPANASIEFTLRDVQSAARTMGLQTKVFNASTSGEINAAFAWCHVPDT